MLRGIRSFKSWVLILGLDGSLFAAAFLGALLIRFDSVLPDSVVASLWRLLPVVIALRLSAFLLCGVYKGAWRFISLHDLICIVQAILASSILLGLVFHVVRPAYVPYSVLIIDAVLALLGTGGIRVLYRIVKESSWPGRKQREQRERRLLIVGARETAEGLVREIKRQVPARYKVVGLVDEGYGMVGKTIHGVRVCGTIEDLPKIVQRKEVEEIVIATSQNGDQLSHMVHRCIQAGIRPKVVPGVEELINNGKISSLIREVQMDDLLTREPVKLDLAGIRQYLEGKTVLITGAAGSIGSELCRQIQTYGPAQMVLFDQWENGLFFLELDLKNRSTSCSIIPIIGDLRDRPRVEFVLEYYRPHVVFHAAAYKHVPLMEQNPEEAIKNNVGGTVNLATLAAKYNVKRFVMISTDKVVQPASMMGVSKRLCELFIRTLSGKGETGFIVTRFGNVLGSEGSVVQVFQRQIEQGGPVTVTHPDMKRFMMTIPEAVSLVLQAAAMGQGGEIFILNMGREMKVLDLAKRLIQLNGLEPDRDIPIQFVGLRPGEKLYERIWIEGEVPEPTAHDNILIVRGDHLPLDRIHTGIYRALSAAEHMDREHLLEEIQAMVPDYRPAPHEGISVDTPLVHRTKVLVADDDPGILAVLKDVFEPIWEVLCAERGDVALEKAFAEMPDLLVLDIRMPGLNGYEVCRKLKYNPMTRWIPIIMLSGLTEEAARTAGFEGGADVYIGKPFSVKELKAAANMLLQREQGALTHREGAPAPKGRWTMDDNRTR